MSYTFCPECSKKLTKKTKNLYVCDNCGFHLYENPRPTNGLIAENEKGEILLVKRLYPPKEGFWDVPGGFVDIGETLEESFQREIKEELGVEVKDLHYLISTADRYLYKGINYHTLCFISTGKIDSKKIVAHDDISEVRFFPKNKVPFAQIAFEGVKKGIKFYLSSFHQSKPSPETK